MRHAPTNFGANLVANLSATEDYPIPAYNEIIYVKRFVTAIFIVVPTLSSSKCICVRETVVSIYPGTRISSLGMEDFLRVCLRISGGLGFLQEFKKLESAKLTNLPFY